MYCAKGDFPHVQYAFYLHALDARRAVKCGNASVTWCGVTANHCRAAHSIPHFTFHIPHAAVPHFTHSLVEMFNCNWYSDYSWSVKHIQCSANIENQISATNLFMKQCHLQNTIIRT